MFKLPKRTNRRSKYNGHFPVDVLFLMITSVFCVACSADVSQNSTPETRPIECNPERDNCDELRGLRDASMIHLDAGPPNEPTPDSDSNANGDEARNGPGEAPADPIGSPAESMTRISIGELSTEPVMTSAGPLNTSTLQSPNGSKARYLRDEILLVTRPDDSLDILEEYQLTHLETLNLGRDKVLHRLHTGHEQSEQQPLENDLGILLQDLQIDQLESSDWLILDTLRTVLKMRRAGLDAVLHPLIETHSLEEPILESPTGPGGYVQDARQWQYLENTNFGYGVKKSWDLLNHIEHRLEPTPPLVAVVDSGFNLNDDLEAVESVHLLGEPSARIQQESHGTQIAGIIAATKNNETGVVGVAAGHSRLALFDYGTPILFRALQAISQAAESDATIINMSWSSAWPLFQKQHGPQALNEWFAELADTALLVAASGNEGIDLDSGPSQLPCGASAVLCVGGLDSLKELSQYSNYGSDEHASDVDLYAPFQVFGFARPNDDRPSAGEVSGTSISAAFISGIAAMVKHAGPQLSPAEIKDILIRHSDRLADQPTLNIGHAFKSLHSVVGETTPLLFIDELDDDQQNQIRLHQPFQLNASSLDFDSEQPVRIDWYSSLDGFLGSGHHIEAIVRQFGEHAIIAVATDAGEMIEAKRMDITVSDTPPNIDIQFPIGDALLYSNRAYTFEAVVSDPDRPDGHVSCRSVQWSILDPQSYRVAGHGCEITVNGLTPGLNVVNVHATDSTGSESSFAVRYHVLP